MRSRFNSPFRSGFSVLRLVVATSLMLLTSLTLGQTVKNLVNFNGGNGAGPDLVSWTQGRDGRLYGTTAAGGASGEGAFIRFDPATQNITVYHSFDGGDGSHPDGGVTLGSDNNFYGTALQGGSFDQGVLYKFTVNGTYTLLHTFTGGSDGGGPLGPPIEATDGNLYGTTSGLIGPSTIYKFTRDGVFSVVYTFKTATTGTHVNGLIQGSDGKLYVTSSGGGPNGCGTIVKVALYGALLDTFPFDCATNGGAPPGPLAQASDGNYYGAAEFGGGFAGGILFELTPASGINGITPLYNFGGSATDGSSPAGNLVQGTDGNLYGSTGSDASKNSGTLYQWSFSNGYRQLYHFEGTFVTTPSGGLTQHTSGLFYGSAVAGGSHNDGMIFSLDMGLEPFVTLIRPQGIVGSNAQILGQGLIGATAVTFSGSPATTFNVVSDTYMTAVVPSGATTGPIVVSTATGSLTSNRNFTVTP
jgi:uncharacterized repeat protein (TIGR03803 family)